MNNQNLTICTFVNLCIARPIAATYAMSQQGEWFDHPLNWLINPDRKKKIWLSHSMILHRHKFNSHAVKRVHFHKRRLFAITIERTSFNDFCPSKRES